MMVSILHKYMQNSDRPSVAKVGLTYYSLPEGTEGGAEICITVDGSDADCPIEYPIAFTLTATGVTAGM